MRPLQDHDVKVSQSFTPLPVIKVTTEEMMKHLTGEAEVAFGRIFWRAVPKQIMNHVLK